jgi:signal peptidase I
MPFMFLLLLSLVLGVLSTTGLLKAYVIPSSAMEPTLRCAKPASGCTASRSDRVLVRREHSPGRGDIVVFETPPEAFERCGAGGTFVKRVVGLPGETWEQRDGFVFINGEKLDEPYLETTRRDGQTHPSRQIPSGHYFMMGDNRSQSCDSRIWGPVERDNLIGVVFATYWPPNRISLY